MTDETLPVGAAEARQERMEAGRRSRYAAAISALLCDGVFDEEDARVLEGFRDHLGVSREVADEVFHDEARRYIRQRILQFLEDGTVSPNEDGILEDLVASIGLGPMWGGETEMALAKARRTWALASTPLPTVYTDLGLVGGEVAYASVAVDAYEERHQTVGVSYAGLTLSLPILKGLRFRAGQFGVNRQSVAYQHHLGAGDLTVTSERLIFRSRKRAITARLTSIIDLTAYTDGVSVQRTTGKPVTYVLADIDEDFALILWRAWQEARGRSITPQDDALRQEEEV